MKNHITIIMFLLLVIACKEENKNDSTNNVIEATNEEFITAKVDGVYYSFGNSISLGNTAKLSHFIIAHNIESKTYLTLGLNLDNEKTGTLQLGDNIVLQYHGLHDFEGTERPYAWRAKESSPGSSGTITITKNNATSLEGTFLFNGIGVAEVDRSEKKITEGKFRVLKK